MPIYYSLPIAIEHQKYLKFFWKGVLYTFTCLPMGLSSSPRIFTKVMKPNPQAKFVDDFTVVWSDMFFYAFPPLCLLPRCVQKITQEQATGILVIPLWTTQSVFSTVLHMLIDVPRIVKASQSNLVHPALVRSHPLHNKLDLLVCKLSGNSYKRQDFQRTLLTSSCPPGDHLPTSSTLSTSTSGYTFVINSKLIPCIHL